jgi:hypothetical protein
MTNNILENVMIYFCMKYPDKLSKTKLAKMIYLADWKFCIEYGQQITDIQWVFRTFGPYAVDIRKLVERNDTFIIKSKYHYLSSQWVEDIISIKKGTSLPSLPERIRDVLDFVIEKPQRLNWDSITKLVGSTYPIMSQPRGSLLNLIQLAKEYNELKKNCGRL